jgi:hypothetical protein
MRFICLLTRTNCMFQKSDPCRICQVKSFKSCFLFGTKELIKMGCFS